MRVLLFGGTGQIGAEICALADGAGLDLVTPGHSNFDLTDCKAVVELLVPAMGHRHQCSRLYECRRR